ncbi:MAG: radical SAM protein [bacterium]
MANISAEISMPIPENDLFRNGYVSFHIMATEWCNLLCGYCYAPHSSKAGISTEQMQTMVGKIEELKLEKYWYDLSGGEIMGHKNWPKLLEIPLSTGQEVSVNTNGTLLNDGNIGILKALNQKYPEKLFLSVSLDSHDPVINKRLRPGEASNNVFHAMELLKENNIRFRVAITLSSVNRETIFNEVRYIVTHYSNELIIGVIRPVFPMTDANKDLLIPLSDIQRIMVDVLSLKGELGDFKVYHCLDEKGNTFCEAGRDRVTIKVNGDVTACYTLQSEKDVIGNIYRDTMSEIARRLHSVHANRDKSVLLCEHQGNIWGEPTYRLGSDETSAAIAYDIDTQNAVNNK